MSVENALAFLEYLQTRDAVRRRIAQLKGAGALRDLAAIGTEEGFDFTEQEYRAAVVHLSEGELSDEALDQLVRDMGMKP